jgi:hypothetical protein
VQPQKSCGTSCAYDTTVLPVDGTYRIVLNPVNAYVGALTAQIYEEQWSCPGGSDVRLDQ